jgi:hypothetical protein
MPRPTLASALRLPTTLALPAVLLAASVLRAQSDAPARSVDAGAQLSSSAALADFDVLRRALEEAHGGFDRFSTRAELNRR